MSILIISIFSIIFDLIFSNFLAYMPNNLSIWTTSFSIITIFLVYKLFVNEDKYYYIYSLIYGFIYDLCFTNLLFYNALLFLLIAFITTKIYKNFEVTIFSNILFIIFIIFVYESVLALSIVNIVPITINKVLYKISHSLISNIIYGEIIYIIVDKFLLKNNKKRRLNR